MKKLIICIITLAHLQAFAQTLFPVEIKGKYGYMNNAGDMIIPAMYDFADDFNEGHAVVALERMPCLINEKNVRVIDTGLYQNIGPVSQQLVAVSDFKKRKFYINLKNEKVITLPEYIYEARRFCNGFAAVSRQVEHHETKFGKDVGTVVYKFAYIDVNGVERTGFDFDDADDFVSGFARIRKGQKFGMLNLSLAEVVPCNFVQVGDVSEGKIVINDQNKFGVMDTTGKWLIKPRFELLYPFSEGYAGFMEKNLFGFIDANGSVLIKPVYVGIRPFAENKAAVMKDGKWGFINTKNEWVIRNVFDNATVFSEGMCAVLYKRYWGFIDATGRLVIPANYDAVGSFSNGVADVVYRDIPVYVDKRGNVIPRLTK